MIITFGPDQRKKTQIPHRLVHHKHKREQKTQMHVERDKKEKRNERTSDGRIHVRHPFACGIISVMSNNAVYTSDENGIKVLANTHTHTHHHNVAREREGEK